MSSVQGKKNNSEVVVPLNNNVEDRLVRMEKELDLFRECLKTLRPIVEEYYGRKELEGLMGYE